MAISIKDVDHVAELARLELSDTEKQLFSDQLSAILQYAEKLNELDTEGVEPTNRASNMENVLREDEVRPSLPIEKVLKNAPDEEDNQIRVPAIIE